jgi:UDP-2,3-diacylglucosamine pyrophosphatase LpxH
MNSTDPRPKSHGQFPNGSGEGPVAFLGNESNRPRIELNRFNDSVMALQQSRDRLSAGPRSDAVTSSSSIARLSSAGSFLDSVTRDSRHVTHLADVRPPTPGAAGRGTAIRVRSIFLSDIHLGSRPCKATRLLEFLKQYEPETIFLLGDIVDFWSLRRSVYWPASHNTVVQKLLRLARRGVRIFYIPGNHDEALRDYLDASFGNIRLEKEHVHVAADGKRYALLHGDQYDQVTTCARWVSMLGDASYNLLVDLNVVLSWVRRKLGVGGHWSLADYAKRNIQGAASFISGFEHAVARHGEALGADGVICGHIHTPAVKRLGGIAYLNCGDWVDSCTAIVENLDGDMELVRQTASSGTSGHANRFADVLAG